MIKTLHFLCCPIGCLTSVCMLLQVSMRWCQQKISMYGCPWRVPACLHRARWTLIVHFSGSRHSNIQIYQKHDSLSSTRICSFRKLTTTCSATYDPQAWSTQHDLPCVLQSIPITFTVIPGVWKTKVGMLLIEILLLKYLMHINQK